MSASSNTPILSAYDQLAIRQSFAAACGMTALHLILEEYEPEEQTRIKENIVTQWRGAWKEAFQGQMNEYNAILHKVTNAHKLSQPEDIQRAFGQMLVEVEKMGRISLRLEEAK